MADLQKFLQPLSVLDDIYGLKEAMRENNIILVYHDEFTDDHYQELLRLTEQKIDAAIVERKIRKRIFHIMVEAVQNISRHAASAPSNIPGSSIFVLGKKENGFFVITGNLIENDHIDKVRSRIETVNGMEKEDLRELYKTTMENEGHNAAGGANLGLIDIARKAGDKMEYSFHKLGDAHSFFTLKINISVAGE